MNPRDLGTIAVVDTESSIIETRYFIKIDFPAPTGTIYLTNKPCGKTGLINLAVGGPAQNWKEFPMEVGPLDESQQHMQSVSWIKFANADSVVNGFAAKQFTTWKRNPGISGVAVTVYVGQFNPQTQAFLGAYQKYSGKFGGGEYDLWAQITLQPNDTTWSKMFPWAMTGPNCVAEYRDPETCAYAGAEPVGEDRCDHSRGACQRRANERNFLGFDLVPFGVEWASG